ncbi:unnamed protein product [Meloidogyne enterolobii]|uniref:Uncharacterized protein n=1 Tax=Meloidogyne enterolobii TaxID=390850 RepID=A0ACB0Y2V4_MELEN
MLMTLEEAESEEDVIYRAIFSPFKLVETTDNPHIEVFLSVYYRQLELPEEAKLTSQECFTLIENMDINPTNSTPNIPFYYYYHYKINSNILQNKLEQFILNNYFINLIVNENVNLNEREYLSEDVFDLYYSPDGDGSAVPHMRLGLFVNIYNHCVTIINEHNAKQSEEEDKSE